MVKNPPAVQETGSSPWVRKILWRQKWQPLQSSSLEIPMDRGAWWATVHGVAKELDMTEQLMCTCVCVYVHMMVTMMSLVTKETGHFVADFH